MKKVAIIGDPHGNLNDYLKIVNHYNNKNIKTISVGDNGFYNEWEWGLQNIDSFKNKWLHGNHDMCTSDYFNCELSLGHSNYWNNIFTIRGAASIDKIHRRFGIDWFEEEQLSAAQANEAINLYYGTLPKVVVSHDCPTDIKRILFGYNTADYTNVVLQEMFELHQPEIWVFGHYHSNEVFQYKKTTFICLDELQSIVVNIDEEN